MLLAIMQDVAALYADTHILAKGNPSDIANEIHAILRAIHTPMIQKGL